MGIDFTKTAKAMLGKYMLDGGFGQFRQLLKWVGWKRDVYVTEYEKLKPRNKYGRINAKRFRAGIDRDRKKYP